MRAAIFTWFPVTEDGLDGWKAERPVPAIYHMKQTIRFLV